MLGILQGSTPPQGPPHTATGFPIWKPLWYGHFNDVDPDMPIPDFSSVLDGGGEVERCGDCVLSGEKRAAAPRSRSASQSRVLHRTRRPSEDVGPDPSGGSPPSGTGCGERVERGGSISVS